MTEWDEKIKPRLNFIAAGAEMASRNARALQVRPPFSTSAVDELNDAEQVLERSLQLIREAMREYGSKQVMA